MFFRHHVDKLIIPIVLAIIFVAASYRSKYRLRTDMPSDFFQQQTNSSKPSLEQRIAWSYWEAAVMNVQWQYPYSHPLPVDPPPEFQINAAALGPGAADAATRLLYWHRLQQIWYLPETWEKVYGWDFTWVSHPIDSSGNWLRDITNNVFGSN